MLKHFLDEYKNQENETWIIVGKGPSFDQAKIKSIPDAKIMAINETVNFVNATCGIFCDLGVLAKIKSERIFWTTKHFVMPASVTRLEYMDHHATEFWARNSGKLSSMFIMKKILFFDLNQSRYQVYKDKPLIHAFNSTYEACIWLLAHAGVKKIFTSGIDHSDGYHPSFGEKPHNNPYTAVKYYAQVAIDAFNMEVKSI